VIPSPPRLTASPARRRADVNCCAIVSSIAADFNILATIIDDGLRVRHG
jgi:hypothetical protein